MMVKNTWLSRLLVRLNDKTWLVCLWLFISPFLIFGPIMIVREMKLRSNAAVLSSHVVEYIPGKHKKLTYLYLYSGKYYVGKDIIMGKKSYNINEPITIIVSRDNPQKGHIWNGNNPSKSNPQ